MRQFYRIGRSFLALLLSKRPKVFWWSVVHQHGYASENFGDILTPYIVEKLTGVKPILFFPKSGFSRYFRHSLMAGSIISQSRKNSIVWGSGIIRRDEAIEGGKFLAVRGPLTALRLQALGFLPPEVYGDPGILLPLLYRPAISKKYKTGIISHYADLDKVGAAVKDYPDIRHISLFTDEIEPVIDQILECGRIISTSLHGIIVAQSYGIPAMWWKVSQLSGDDVKFYDYFGSVKLSDVASNEKMQLKDIIENGRYDLPDRDVITELQQGLLKTFPYKITDYASR